MSVRIALDGNRRDIDFFSFCFWKILWVGLVQTRWLLVCHFRNANICPLIVSLEYPFFCPRCFFLRLVLPGPGYRRYVSACGGCRGRFHLNLYRKRLTVRMQEEGSRIGNFALDVEAEWVIKASRCSARRKAWRRERGVYRTISREIRLCENSSGELRVNSATNICATDFVKCFRLYLAALANTSFGRISRLRIMFTVASQIPNIFSLWSRLEELCNYFTIYLLWSKSTGNHLL